MFSKSGGLWSDFHRFIRSVHYEVNPSYIGSRVDKFVMDKYPRVPYSLIQRELRERKIYCIDSSTSEKIRCKPGDHFSAATILHIPNFFEKVSNDFKDQSHLFQASNRWSVKESILFEDSHLIVLNKPSGVCCQAESGSVLSSLQACYPSTLFYPVHRLDKETTGVLMVAKDRETARMVSHEIASGFVYKMYLAVGVDTHFSANQIPFTGIIYSDMSKVQLYENAIFKATHISIRKCPLHQLPSIVKSSSQTPAITGYDVLHKQQNIVALRCHLYTGKTHQIRVHLRDALGIEIVNDKKYGHKAILPRRMEIDKKAMYLHCQTIKLRYNGHTLTFDAPIPDHFSKLPFTYHL